MSFFLTPQGIYMKFTLLENMPPNMIGLTSLAMISSSAHPAHHHAH